VHEYHGQQMVDRERIVGTLLENLLELLGGAVVLHVVEVFEGGVGLGIVRGGVENIRRGFDLGIGGDGKRGERAQKDHERPGARITPPLPGQPLGSELVRLYCHGSILSPSLNQV